MGTVDPVFAAGSIPGAIRPWRPLRPGVGEPEHFAAAASPGSTHVVIATMGHGDVLDDRPARAARRLCRGSDDPRFERDTVAELIERFVSAETGA